METRKFCFCTHHAGPELEAYTLATYKALGATCTVEVTFETRHRFELHTLVCVMPKKVHPVKFTTA